MYEDRGRAAEMGRNGSNAVLNRYNWRVEEIKLIEFYEDLLETKAGR